MAALATQPLSHSVTQLLREWLSGWSSHSTRVAEWLRWIFHQRVLKLKLKTLIQLHTITYFLRVIPTLTHYILTYSDIVSDISSGSAFYPTFFLASILTFFLAVAFYLASILTYFLAYMLTFFLALYLVSILTFFLAATVSGIPFWHSIWHLFWHSGWGRAHWDPARGLRSEAAWENLGTETLTWQVGKNIRFSISKSATSLFNILPTNWNLDGSPTIKLNNLIQKHWNVWFWRTDTNEQHPGVD